MLKILRKCIKLFTKFEVNDVIYAPLIVGVIEPSRDLCTKKIMRLFIVLWVTREV